MNRIIYQKSDGSVSVLVSTPEVIETFGIEKIAEKDVPSGLPYWFANDSDIPTDRSQRDAWEIDETMGEPDGFGGESSEFSDDDLMKILPKE